MSVGFAGSSITYQPASYGYRPLSVAYMQTLPQYLYTFNSIAANGWDTWANLFLLDTLLAASPDLIVFDQMNNDGSDWRAACVEAFIRRVWAANPNTRLIGMNFFQVADQNVDADVDTPTSQTAQDKYTAILNAYGVPIVDFYAAVKALVDGGAHLSDYLADTIHPSATGYALAAQLLEPYLPTGGAVKPGNYPAPLYDASGNYQNTPVAEAGNAYDSKTGAWTDTAGTMTSSTPGDTITYSATCQSFGVSNNDCPACSVSVDGGAFATGQTLYQNGTVIGAGRGAHTITVKVETSVKIVNFWAI